MVFGEGGGGERGKESLSLFKNTCSFSSFDFYPFSSLFRTLLIQQTYCGLSLLHIIKHVLFKSLKVDIYIIQWADTRKECPMIDICIVVIKRILFELLNL